MKYKQTHIPKSGGDRQNVTSQSSVKHEKNLEPYAAVSAFTDGHMSKKVRSNGNLKK